MNDTLLLLREAAGGKTGTEALEAMGRAYQEKLITDREWLLMQLQTFAACYDDDVQHQTRRCLQDLWNEIEKLTGGVSVESRVTFFAMGMFCNVIAAVGQIEGTDTAWAPILEALTNVKHVLR
jgi:hypothetical protein